MTINLSSLDLSSIPDRPEGSDETVLVFAVRRPDQPGVDSDPGEAIGAAVRDFEAALLAALGDGGTVDLVIRTTNVETVDPTTT